MPDDEDAPDLPERLRTSRRLLIGPVNSAGQATAWARAITRHAPESSAHSFTFTRERMGFPTDLLVEAARYRQDKQWAARFRDDVLENYTHVIMESNRPLFGMVGRPDARVDLDDLRGAGIKVALLAHGSDVRVPSYHNRLEPWSPFPDLESKYAATLERHARATMDLYTGYSGPVFVSTAALLSFVPNATWCPVVVDVPVWANEHAVMVRDRPIVVHAPSRSVLKGSHLIDPLLDEMCRRGVIEYRRVENVEPADMPALYMDADIVVDLVGTANYGAAACEAMAAGRIVVSHVSELVRGSVRERTGLELPIVEATPNTIVDVVARLMEDRDEARRIGALGSAFVGAVHDGRQSVKAFEPFLLASEAAAARWKPDAQRPRVTVLAATDVAKDERTMWFAHTVARCGFAVEVVGADGARPRRSRRIGRLAVRSPRFPSPDEICRKDFRDYRRSADTGKRVPRLRARVRRAVTAILGRKIDDSVWHPTAWTISREKVLRRILDRMRPALIEVHDAELLPHAVRARERAARRGRNVGILYVSRGGPGTHRPGSGPAHSFARAIDLVIVETEREVEAWSAPAGLQNLSVVVPDASAHEPSAGLRVMAAYEQVLGDLPVLARVELPDLSIPPPTR